MKKILKFVIAAVFVLSLFSVGELLADIRILQNQMIRLHVVANSDSEADQSNKLAVRDEVLKYLDRHLSNISTARQAEEYLSGAVEDIENIVNNTLAQLQARYRGKVSLKKEAFTLREYETFRLPSGVYTALKIDLGKGEGENWWCVAFPALCAPITTDDFQMTAVQAGISETFAKTISNNSEKNIRFFFLDCIGKIENLLHIS